MPISVFKTRYAAQYANPRNLAAGALKQKDATKTGAYSLRFFAYDVVGVELDSEISKNEYLKKIGFEPVDTILVTHADLQTAYDKILELRATLDYETDGVVYKANSLAEQQRMGLTSHHPRYAIAYKFQEIMVRACCGTSSGACRGRGRSTRWAWWTLWSCRARW